MVVIALTGLPGSGSSSIAKQLAKKLGLEYFSPGDYYKKLFSGTNSLAALKGWKSEKGKSKSLHEQIDKIQIEKARKGNVVICGKLSLYFLKDLADLKIWVDADLKVRAKRTAERDGISFEEAEKIIKEREAYEEKGFKRIYGINYKALKENADFVLDNSNLSLEEAVEKVLEFIRKKC